VNSVRNAVYAAIAGVFLLLAVVLAERHFLDAAEERGRKSGAAIQHATDQLATDSALARVERLAQAKLDSVEHEAAVKFAHADTVYRTARARLVTDTLFQHDTVAQQVLKTADDDVHACKEDLLSCAAARANAERDAARAHLTVSERDATILEMAHTTAPPPRSCTAPAILSGVLGALVGHALH
jgi:hypothetical protein